LHHFERHVLKPGLVFKGKGLNWNQTPFSYGSGGVNAQRPTSSSTSIEMLVLLAPWLIIFTLTHAAPVGRGVGYHFSPRYYCASKHQLMTASMCVKTPVDDSQYVRQNTPVDDSQYVHVTNLAPRSDQPTLVGRMIRSISWWRPRVTTPTQRAEGALHDFVVALDVADERDERVARGVALQVAFERQTLKPVFRLIGFRLWVWKVIGYGLWVNLIQPAEPHRGALDARDAVLLDVALQVAFWKANFETGFSLDRV
jgi:hypothetical protein